MKRIGYLDCVGGLAGDMLVAALLDAGAPADPLERLSEELGIEPVSVSITRVERQGVGALHVEFALVSEDDRHRHRDWREIRTLLETARLPEAIRQRALTTFERLAEAEARVHGVPVDRVHFHELGAVDTLMDICGAISLVESLGLDVMISSPLPVARGHVDTDHGTVPLPAPATLELLTGASVYGVESGGELVTPTGAALAAQLVSSWGDIPAMTLETSGAGAGTRDLPDRANIVRVLIGTMSPAIAHGDVVLLETNLDDLSPELVPDAVEACFAAGALDVWTITAQMKKGRPGIVFTALARPADGARVARAMLEHTTALGVRSRHMHRVELEREIREVTVEGGTVRVKIGRLDGDVVNMAPEHDDCAAIAARTGQPVKLVWAAALAAAGQT
jgi:uncharacterized protein (TIGR00299 family) protein